jgi:hypothetical protein
MKNTLASMIIVIFLALVVSQAVPASANFANPSKSQTEPHENQLMGVNITPINVKTGGTLTATGYVERYCSDCTPPGWQPAAGAEVHFDNVTEDTNTWYPQASGTTDSNGYFSLTCQVPSTAGPYLYGVYVPKKGLEGGAQLGPWIVIATD